MSNPYENLLTDVAWDSGLAIPVANQKNKELEEKVQQQQSQTSDYKKNLSSVEDKLHALYEHLKNVKNELQHTQSLIDARNKEIETEDHLRKVCEREQGRLMQEAKRIDKEIEELNEKKNDSENNIFKLQEKLDNAKAQMRWDQQTLEAWLEESARKDEDNMTIEKYARQDEGKIKELSLQIEKLTDEHDKKKANLDKETTDLLTAQLELDKTAEQFRTLHQDRKELIDRWEKTIQQMQRRDQEMEVLSATITRLKASLSEQAQSIQEKEEFLKNEQANNAEVEKKIGIAERAAGRIKEQLQEAMFNKDQMQSELDAHKRTVDRSAVDLEQARAALTHLKNELADKTTKLNMVMEIIEELHEKKKLANTKSLSSEERAAQLDDMFQKEEKTQQQLEYQLEQFRAQIFKKKEKLHEIEEKSKTKTAEIEGSSAALRNLSTRINQLDHDALKQQEILYNQEFALQQLERRLGRMHGESNNNEKLILEERLANLNEIFSEKKGTIGLLTSQMKHLENDIRHVKRDVLNYNTERDAISIKISEFENHNENSQKELKRLHKEKNTSLVDEHLLRLEVKRLRELLFGKAGKVMDLEKRRLQLETAIKERKIEVDNHKEMLLLQLRAAEDQRQQTSIELHERISKIDKLRKRFEILTVAMAPPEGEEEHSQAYYVIKAAQDKEELQRKGDQLDAQIIKAEKELRALENTVRLLNNRNETYRKSFHKVTTTSEEMEEKMRLEDQFGNAMDRMKVKRREFREVQEDVNLMMANLETLERDEVGFLQLNDEKEARLKQLHNEIQEQQAKLERASKQTVRIAKDLRAKAKLKEKTPEENDLEIREMKDFYRGLVKQVSDIVKTQPQYGDTIVNYFNQSGIQLESSTPASMYSSRASSRLSVGSKKSTLSARSDSTGSGTPGPAMINIGEDLEGMSSRSEKSTASSRVSSKKSLLLEKH